MVFSSLIFLFYFLPISLFMYYIVPQKYIEIRNLTFLVSSLFFYFYGEPKLIIVMLFSICLNYIFGLLMESNHRKILLTLCIIANLLILGFFKYFNFFITTTNEIFQSQFNVLNIIMPIGISFFTFQSLSYVVDVYRKEVPPQKNIINLALYISMFPQLIAGPIVRYKDINHSLEFREHNTIIFSNGLDRFIFGLSKKVLLSNVFAIITDYTFGLSITELTFSMSWFGAICYTLQIYFDFSGYSDMAIGLGKMFGFTFLENFNYPYISKSLTEFWRRWHISLGTWFRDYVYIPIGGNRCSLFRNVLNILVVWILTGFWHGANFTFIAWGLFYAIILILEKIFMLKFLEKIPKLLQHTYALLFIIIGWVIFRSDTLSFAIQYIGIMFSPELLVDNKILEFVNMYYLELIFGLVLSMPIFPLYLNKMKNKNEVLQIIMIILTISLLGLNLLALINSSYNPFIYFRF